MSRSSSLRPDFGAGNGADVTSSMTPAVAASSMPTTWGREGSLVPGLLSTRICDNINFYDTLVKIFPIPIRFSIEIEVFFFLKAYLTPGVLVCNLSDFRCDHKGVGTDF